VPHAADQRTFVRTLAGVSLIAAPLLLLASTLIGPNLSDDGARRLSQIADNDARYVASRYLLVLGAWAFVPGLLGLSRLFRGPRVTLGQVGAALVLLGWISTIAFFGLGAYEHEAARPSLDRTVMGHLVDRVSDSGVLIPFIVVTFVVGIALGSLIVAWSLWRRRIVRAWASAALVAWTVLDIVADSTAVSALALVFLLLGFGAVGLKLLSAPNDEWDAPARAA
jgi:hypothetical protein